MTVSRALTASLKAVALRPEDKAAAELARKYAAQVDASPDALVKVGPLLLACLESLGMTAKGRAAALGKGGDRGQGAQQRSATDELVERRAARRAGKH